MPGVEQFTLKIPSHLIDIIDSLREGSFNRSIVNAAPELVSPDAGLIKMSVKDIALYDGDFESTGDPAAVTRLKLDVNPDGAKAEAMPMSPQTVPPHTNAIHAKVTPATP